MFPTAQVNPHTNAANARALQRAIPCVHVSPRDIIVFISVCWATRVTSLSQLPEFARQV
jgi:hypothetical protein